MMGQMCARGVLAVCCKIQTCADTARLHGLFGIQFRLGAGWRLSPYPKPRLPCEATWIYVSWYNSKKPNVMPGLAGGRVGIWQKPAMQIPGSSLLGLILPCSAFFLPQTTPCPPLNQPLPAHEPLSAHLHAPINTRSRSGTAEPVHVSSLAKLGAK